MAFIPVPNTALVELVYQQSDQITENTLYFEGATPWDATSLTELAEEVRDWWIAGPRTDTSDSTALRVVRATSLESQSAPGVEIAITSGGLGAETSPALPNNVTQVTTFITALRGRAYRGRNYRVGMTENMTTGNTVDGTYTSSWNTMYVGLNTAVTANSAVHVVVSRQLNNVPRTTGVATPVVSYRTDDTVDSQRRRLPGRGQ